MYIVLVEMGEGFVGHSGKMSVVSVGYSGSNGNVYL